MNGCHEFAPDTPDLQAAPTQPSPSSEHNLRLLSWLMDYELRAAERYRRYVALLLVSAAPQCRFLKNLLLRSKRDCDKIFELDAACAILMSETDLAGALAVVDRYKAVGNGDLDLRFAIAAFPGDGGNSADLLATVQRRLAAAQQRGIGAVVCNG